MALRPATLATIFFPICWSIALGQGLFAPQNVHGAPRPDTADDVRVKPDVPKWAADARWYHVIVPLFHSGERSNDPEDALPWPRGIAPPGESSSHGKLARRDRRYGGDLQGLQQRLDYLKALGVNTLYLSGLLDASLPVGGRVELHHVGASRGFNDEPDGHAAETSGPERWKWSADDKVFLRFVDAAHAQGFRVVIEAPFDRAPISTSDAAEFQRYAFAVTHRWMDPDSDAKPADGVDGWVVANPQHIAAAFWKRWRTYTKEINPDVLLVADVQKNPGSWVKGDQFDVAINYELARAVRRYFSTGEDRLETKEFVNQLEMLGRQLPSDVQLACPVPLSGPRLGRILHELSFQRQTAGKGNETAKLVVDRQGGAQRWQLAAFLQYFFPGAPMTLYGEELGMYCTKGDGCLAPMPWPDLHDNKAGFDAEVRRFSALIRFLNTRRTVDRPLTRGTLEQVPGSENKQRILTLARRLGDEEVLLAMNCGDGRGEVLLPAGTPGRLAVVLGPRLHQTAAPKTLRRHDAVAGKKKSAARSDSSPEMTVKGKEASGRALDLIVPLSVGGSRRIVDSTGRIRLLIGPMSVRLVIVRR